MALAVLLVDDEHQNDGPFREGLLAGSPGAKLMVARTGREGLALLRATQHAGVDDVAAVFLDLALPEQSGIDVLRDLRMQADMRNVPVVVLTRSHHEVDIWLSYKVGANAYMVKDEAKFAGQIAQAVNFWCKHNLRVPPAAQAI